MTGLVQRTCSPARAWRAGESDSAGAEPSLGRKGAAEYRRQRAVRQSRRGAVRFSCPGWCGAASRAVAQSRLVGRTSPSSRSGEQVEEAGRERAGHELLDRLGRVERERRLGGALAVGHRHPAERLLDLRDRRGLHRQLAQTEPEQEHRGQRIARHGAAERDRHARAPRPRARPAGSSAGWRGETATRAARASGCPGRWRACTG